jgi:hypothetical protein
MTCNRTGLVIFDLILRKREALSRRMGCIHRSKGPILRDAAVRLLRMRLSGVRKRFNGGAV